MVLAVVVVVVADGLPLRIVGEYVAKVCVVLATA